MSQKKARIGVLLTLGAQEAYKEDIINVEQKSPARPWLKVAPESLKIFRKAGRGFLSNQAKPTIYGYPTDVAIPEYIKFKYGKNFDIDYIHPREVSAARLKKNDINFLVTYDLLEAYHINKSKARFHRFKRALQECSNIFPDYNYQEFVNSKIMYYNYLEGKGIPIQPTITITTQQWRDRVKQLSRTHKGDEAYLAATVEIIEEIKRRGIEEYICKPDYGQESKAIRFFNVKRKQDVDKLNNHLCWTFDHFPGVVIQEVVPKFGSGKKCPELRMYFCGEEYQHSVFFEKKGLVTLKCEGGTRAVPQHVDLEACKALALRTVKCLPDIMLKNGGQNVVLPKMTTRIDVGCIRNGIFDPWVNEVEFVPSLFVEFHRHPVDATIGERMAMIAKKFLSRKGLKSSNRVTSSRPLTIQTWMKGPQKVSGIKKKVINHTFKKN